jgi:hypothetical protein
LVEEVLPVVARDLAEGVTAASRLGELQAVFIELIPVLVFTFR